MPEVFGHIPDNSTAAAAGASVPISAAAPAPVTAIDTSAAGKIETWFAEHFHNSAVSRAPTEIYNAVHAAKEELKAIFSAKDAPSGPVAVSKAVEDWHAAHFIASPIARAGEEISELCRKAKEALKALFGA